MTDVRRDNTRDKVKNVALRLFGEHGVDAVSVRDIAAAAGQKNIGAVGYHFGNKDALVQELLIDGAKVIDMRRNEMLDTLESSGQKINLRDVISIIVYSSINIRDDSGNEAYNRFFWMMQLRSREVFESIVGGKLDLGFRRCIDHLRKLIPDLERHVLNERIIFLMLMLGANLCMREEGLEQYDNEFSNVYGGSIWTSDTLIENIVDSCTGMFLYATPSENSGKKKN